MYWIFSIHRESRWFFFCLRRKMGGIIFSFFFFLFFTAVNFYGEKEVSVSLDGLFQIIIHIGRGVRIPCINVESEMTDLKSPTEGALFGTLPGSRGGEQPNIYICHPARGRSHNCRKTSNAVRSSSSFQHIFSYSFFYFFFFYNNAPFFESSPFHSTRIPERTKEII